MKQEDSYDSLEEEEEEELENEDEQGSQDDVDSELEFTMDDNEEFNSQELEMNGIEVDLGDLVKHDNDEIRIKQGQGTGFTRGLDKVEKERIYKITTGQTRSDEMNAEALKFL